MPRLITTLSRGALALAALFIFACAAPTASSARPPAGQPQTGLRLEALEIQTQRGKLAFTVEIADTQETRDYGMMFRREIGPSRGMLFHFQEVRPVAFWMRNTLIPLDIIYISPNGTVLNIVNARALDETPLPSRGPVRGVLEVRGGLAAQLGIRPGDKVRHRIFRR